MPLPPIKTSEEYHTALERLSALMDTPADDLEAGEELSQLADVLVEYEEENFPIPLPSLLEAIEFRLEEVAVSPAELEEIFGTTNIKSVVAEDKPLDEETIQKIHQKLDIPLAILLKAKENRAK